MKHIIFKNQPIHTHSHKQILRKAKQESRI